LLWAIAAVGGGVPTEFSVGWIGLLRVEVYSRESRSGLFNTLSTGSPEETYIKKEAQEYTSLANDRRCIAG
jgi:hypothetical protein